MHFVLSRTSWSSVLDSVRSLFRPGSIRKAEQSFLSWPLHPGAWEASWGSGGKAPSLGGSWLRSAEREARLAAAALHAFLSSYFLFFSFPFPSYFFP